MQSQRILTYFVRENITVRMTSHLTGLDTTKQVNLLQMFMQAMQLNRKQII